MRRPTIVLVVFAYALAHVCATGASLPAAARGQAESSTKLTACIFDKRVGERLCESRWSSPESCQWVPILENVAGGQLEEAEKIFAATFGFDAALTSRALPYIAGSMLQSLDDECATRQRKDLDTLFLDRATKPFLEDLPLFVVLPSYRTLGLPEFGDLFADGLSDDLMRSVSRLGVSWWRVYDEFAYELILLQLGIRPVGSDLFRLARAAETLAQNGRARERITNLFEDWGSGSVEKLLKDADIFVTKETAEEAQAQIEIKELLASLQGSDISTRRKRLDEWVERQDPRVAVDFASLLASSGLALEGLALLERMKPELSRAEGTAAKILHSRAQWIESWLWAELGQETESREAFLQAGRSKDRWSQLIMKNFPEPNRSGISSLDYDIFVTEEPYADPANPSSGRNPLYRYDRTISAEVARLADLFKAQGANELSIEAKAFVEKYPSYRNLDWLFWASELFQSVGQPTRARETLEQALVYLEDRLGPFLEDETARSLIDSRIFRFYSRAVRSAMAREGQEALSHAERGRSFTLRRLLGDRQRSVAVSFFPGQEDLEEQIGELERSASADPERLRDLHRRFESSRLRQRLAGMADLPAENVSRSRIPLEQQQTLLGENLLVFYDTRGGIPHLMASLLNKESDEAQLATWLVNLRGTRQFSQLLGSADWEAIECWSQAIRWQETDESTRGPARGRGVRILTQCPGSSPDVDPAEELYRRLIYPAEGSLTRGSRLTLVPHRQLNGVPFAALRNPQTGRRLAEDFEISIVPSIEVLHRLRDRRR